MKTIISSNRLTRAFPIPILSGGLDAFLFKGVV